MDQHKLDLVSLQKKEEEEEDFKENKEEEKDKIGWEGTEWNCEME